MLTPSFILVFCGSEIIFFVAAINLGLMEDFCWDACISINWIVESRLNKIYGFRFHSFDGSSLSGESMEVVRKPRLILAAAVRISYQLLHVLELQMSRN